MKHFKLYHIFFLLALLIIAGFFVSQEARAAACANVPISGPYEITESCVFEGDINGVEEGDLIIKSGTLTINPIEGSEVGQTVVWNSGFAVRLDGGSIAIGKGNETSGGGQLRKAYICLKDADSDTYPATTTYYDSSDACSNVANGYRRSNTRFTEHANGWTYVSDIQLDYNDASASVYPGTNCGEGYLCDVNTDAGTCGLKTASCLAVCQRCDGVSIDVEYASTAGHVCYGSGQWKAVDTTDYCTLVNECDGACTRASRYRGCTVGSTSCTATNQHTVNSYASTAGHVCSAGSWTATKTADLHCDKGIQCPGSTVCSATLYYRGCAIGGTSCVSDNWASYSTWNASADQAITQTGWVQNGTDCTQSSDQHCAACLRCDGGGGCSACLTHTNTGLFGCVPDDYCCHCECTPKHISCPF